eukprot:1181282-Prymnesium_polylepis.1
MARAPMWMQGLLTLLAQRVDSAILTRLPFGSFDLETQYLAAFRILQNGTNTGKMVMRIGAHSSGLGGAHVVTGGTSGLGMLTGRWLAQRGARRLVLASRSGKLAQDTKSEWQAAVQASGGTEPLKERCDTGETEHIRRMFRVVLPLG